VSKKKCKDPAQLRKRMRREERLTAAREWLPAHRGMEVQELVEAYERWYGVDRLCAIIELRLIDVPISEEDEVQVRDALVQREKARAAERAIKQAAKRAAKLHAEAKRAERRRAEQQRAEAKREAKRAEKQRTAGGPAARARSSQPADALAWTSWAEMGIDAECRAMEDYVPDRYEGYAERSIEDALFDDARAVDLRVIETRVETEVETKATIETEIQIETKTTIEATSETKTTIETTSETEIKRLDGRRVRLRILLEADPAVLARRAWGVIFAISAFSFADADADADVDAVDYYEWGPDDMLRCLAFDRGRLCFDADHVHGRCMQTKIEIDGGGKITLETVNRGEIASRWITKLQGKQARPVIEPYLDEIPF